MSKKQERKKVRAFPIMLILTAILLVASTYAWFVANQTTRIKSLKLGVDEVAGLQISADAVVWRADLDSSILTSGDITTNYPGNKNQIPSVNTIVTGDTMNSDGTVKPVSSDGTTDTTNGTLNMYKGEVSINNETGNFELKATKETDTKGTSGNYFAFDFFLKADKNMSIDLDPTSSVKVSDSYTDTGLQSAARVAFIQLGHGDLTTSADTIKAYKTPSKVYFWEPYAETHKAYLGITGAQKTNAINKAIETAIVYNGRHTTNASYFTAVGNEAITYSKPESGIQYLTTGTVVDDDGDKFIELTAGITKFRGYVWIEGEDADCNNDITGSQIVTDISFTVDGQTPRS